MTIEPTAGARAPGRRTEITTLSRPAPLAAATRTRPGLIAWTRPVARSTRAIVESLEDQVIAAPGSTCPDAFRTSAARLVPLSGRSDRAGR